MLLSLFALLLVGTYLSFASAEYLSHKQNTNFDLVVTSNNGTACNLSNIQYPDGSQTIYNLALTKDGQTFYSTIDAGNYSQLGSTCHNIVCTDGVSYETGSVCREITSDGGSSVFKVMLVIAIAATLVFLFGYFTHNVVFVYISGIMFLVLGVFTLINGFGDVRDTYTDVIGYVAIGFSIMFFVVGAYEQLSGGEGDDD